MEQRRNRERLVKHISGNYSLKELHDMGFKSPVVQGFHDLTDLNKLALRATPEQIKKLKEQQLNGNYGVQDYSNIRDALLQTQKLNQDFTKLPAAIREHFKNDEFMYHDYLIANKENKYALAELSAEISGSESHKKRIERQKSIEKQQVELDLKQKTELAQLIKDAVAPKP